MVWFFIGLCIGGIVIAFVLSILFSGKIDDYENEIIKLRKIICGKCDEEVFNCNRCEHGFYK